MHQTRIGLRLESLGMPFRQALENAERLGAAGVQVDATGDLNPNALSGTGRREIGRLLRVHNLELTALGCPLRQGFDTSENQQPRIEHVKKVQALCYDLGARVVIVQAGRIPQDKQMPGTQLLSEALLDLGRFGDRIGTMLALETGLDSGEHLAEFLTQFDTGGLGVNMDPANLLLNGFDYLASTRGLQRWIKHVHAKDARRSTANRAAQEVALGHGDIDWIEYLGLLEEVEYHGWVTVECESGLNTQKDATTGIEFLRRLGV